MNYFEFFQVPVSFLLDEAELKRKFYANSKRFHPDFFSLESDEKQAEILELSTLNNKAYKTLSDFDLRMRYILDLKGILEEEGKNHIPQDFLVDMMDINEKLMELEFDFDEQIYQSVQKELAALQEAAYREVGPLLENYEDEKAAEGELKKIKDYYLKKRYLLRIQENLSKFAHR